MDTLPLPPHPSLDQYKKRAKDLVKAANSPDLEAVRTWASDWLANLASRLGVTVTPFVQHSFDRAVEDIDARVRNHAEASGAGSPFKLADAQWLIARAHSFENWAAFVRHLEGAASRDPRDHEFEAGADAIVSGDLATLESLLRQNPSLIRARSERTHRSTLLHYVAANGIEDFRQKTPPSAVTIARCLLDAGAEVDALSNSYGGDRYQTTMNLLVSSTHPADAGLQPALVETLLDFGAAINGLDDDSSPLMTALAFGYRDAAETLARRGARIDGVLAASALGRLDLVRQFVVDKHTLRAGVPLVKPAWMSVPPGPKAHIDLAFIWACKFARTAVAEFFLDLGVDVAVSDDMTPLHWAAATGCLDLMAALIERGAPLEKKNVWGGTVLDSTVYFAVHQLIGGVDYPRVLEALIAAGANVSAVTPFPTGHPVIDELLRRHGARPS